MFKNPPKDCQLCPRLVAYRRESQAKFPDKYNGAVPSFGPITAKMLVVGLAPGLKGANFTGRPFTGDYAGDVLYPALLRHGFGTGIFKSRPDDGVELTNARITNAVRCVPPQNKPIGEEENNCRPFLIEEMTSMPNLKVLFVLGCIAHVAVLKVLGLKIKDYPFGHEQVNKLPNGLILVSSYHCSRYNVNTGRLTEDMFDSVMAKAKSFL
ncbi:MAG: uracil-DNA glycosylase [Micavibrio sp.]|nr:uracil-DNA glycosylase [Micavibrio sp.]|tara:strand:+ start:2270 stop:2899 length:630 start_codon:yes stop_codon:yes gene_type:complete